MSLPELSIIIPTLNEADTLPLLLDDLGRQADINIQVIVSDGGSADATCERAETVFASGQLCGSCCRGPSGRGRQLNAGAMVAKSDWLLFLHADSRLDDPGQLKTALDVLTKHHEQSVSDSSAGRFALRFDAQERDADFGLYFYQAKAQLGRFGCIHGDQGMLMTKAFFQRVGPFREDLPVMEDTSLAEIIHTQGQWLLLPGEIVTSARRFRAEGIKARQTLNALMMNFRSIGWLEFFDKSPDLYRQQDRSQPLRLRPFFSLIRTLLDAMPFKDRWHLWMATGGYVRSQAWQIGLAMDCRRAFAQGLGPGEQGDRWLRWFDHSFEPMTNHVVGRAVTALLVRTWFSWQLFQSR